MSPDGQQVGRKGLNRCASVWACPVCEAVIRGVRASDADKAITEHVRRGGMVLFVTFTVRHWSNHDLEDLIRVQVREVWKGLLQGRKWARSEAGNLRNRLGVVGTIRVIEVTVGQVNGWHPHLHVAVLLGGVQDPKPKKLKKGVQGPRQQWDPTVRRYFTPDAEDLDAFEAEWKAAWIDGVTAANPDFRPSARDGVDFQRVYTVKDAAAVGKYISKVQGTDVASDWSVGAELAMSHVKQARGGNMKAMDILFRLAALRGGQVADELPGWGSIDQLLALWAEYELTTKGGQNMAWSEGLKRAYGIGTDDDQDAADRQAVDAEDAGTQLDRLIHVSARTQLEIGRKRVMVEVNEAARDAVKREEDPVIAVRAVLALVGIDSMGVWELSHDADEAKWKAAAENAAVSSGESEHARAERREQEATDLNQARGDRKRLIWKPQE
ncbi:protein rep [Streptomyces sp. SID3915]|uniref:protein rep n=1 Tax=Streptomyces sp. SID3915 TaxID=2690263 RepID=UPI001371D903|nr:protein rep [Streptomyces sp. SID3915]MYX75088.1 protein rep [Streptomyces sp. SID3915]